ncbi:putative related to general repressor of transcription [Rosellinia necatrix]|uniref:Putative related to general repressor of transcription n=1 Tax=Rosellinia necatrix TaxID=77044 RepID=A0A1W2TEZ2_ROSNE|nr:putative related to general repressor of transcription [Rosellinia necatrix]
MALYPGPRPQSMSMSPGYEDAPSPNAASSTMSMSPSMSGTPAANTGPTPQPVKRRAPIACRRCRRLRSKCLHDKAPPCKACKEAGVPEECAFPSRGDLDQDRAFRHPRQRADKKHKPDLVKVKREPTVTSNLGLDAFSNYRPPKLANEWDLLPEMEVIVDGINTFIRHFYQIGFIPKKMFIAGLRENSESVSVFLLLSILCISARFNKYFIRSYGDGLKAADEFMQKAQRLAINEIYLEPTLERCQAFYLLSIAEQGSGKSNTSYISAGIAFRMAALMRLHREEAYSPITSKSHIVQRIRAEAARRTFWMLHSQDNLHSGPYKPVSLGPSDITALLPCNEPDFEAGRIPEKRAALEGTPPAIADPSLCSLRPRPLLASLMQVHNFWGIIARRILYNEKDWRPQDEDSEFAKLNRRLRDWERDLPPEHAFGRILLGGYRHYEEDLAYLSLTGCLRLCHIVLRKVYLSEMIRHSQGDPSNPEVKFYQNMSNDLFCNVRVLYEQIDAHFEDGTPIESLGSQMAAFIIYSCGLLAAYLVKFPQLDVQHVGNDLQAAQAEGRMIYARSLGILRAYSHTWPLATAWANGLEKWFKDQNSKKISFQSGTMTDGIEEPQPYALGAVHPRINPPGFRGTPSIKKFHTSRSTTPPTASSQRKAADMGAAGEPPHLAPLQQAQSTYGEPVCLPPLSQTQYVTSPLQSNMSQPSSYAPPPAPQVALAQAHQPQPQPQQHPPQQQQQSMSHSHTHLHVQPQPQPPSQPTSQQSYATQPYGQSTGLDMLIQASTSTHPPAAPPIDAYTAAYYGDYNNMTLNDGFDSNLQIMVDGGARWTAIDATTAIYSPYGPIGSGP